MNSQTDLDVMNTSIANPSLNTRIKSPSSLFRYRAMIFYRFLVAVFGGYLLASLSALVLAKTFADFRVSSVMSATMIAFMIHCAAFIWVFMVNKTLKASLGIFIPCLILFVIHQVWGN